MKKFEVTFEGDQIPLGKRLNCVLRNKHIKQRDLAARVYVEETCISKYICGRAYPRSKKGRRAIFHTRFSLNDDP